MTAAESLTLKSSTHLFKNNTIFFNSLLNSFINVATVPTLGEVACCVNPGIVVGKLVTYD